MQDEKLLKIVFQQARWEKK